MECLLCPVVSHSAESGTGNTRSLFDHPEEWGLLTDLHTVSAGYRRENHLAEVLKQATAMDPVISASDLQCIYANYCHQVDRWLAEGAYPSRYAIPIDEFTLADIRPLLLPLGHELVKKYTERWLQIRRYLYWREFDVEEDRSKLLSYSECEKVHRLYVIFVKAFDGLKEERHPLFVYRHNILFLNTCVTHLLHQIDPELAKRQKWYFTDLETIGSRLITEHRIALILKYLRSHPEINGGYDWFYQCLLPEEDQELYRTNPTRFLSILRTQINQCRQPPKRLKALLQAQQQCSAQSPATDLQAASQSTLTEDEQSWISFLESQPRGHLGL